MSRGEDDFLGRWSSRKLKARTEPEPAAPPAPPPVEAAPEAEKSDEEVLRELGLPDPETMVKGDDFSAFLKAGVPLRLRNRALRKLWLSDPVLANLDGLNDYDEDYTDAATVVKGMKTAYKVGRGFLRDPEPEAAPEPTVAEAAEGGDAAAAPGGATTTSDATATVVSDAHEETSAPPEEGPAATAEPGEPAAAAEGSVQPADDMAMRPRRMRFQFSNG